MKEYLWNEGYAASVWKKTYFFQTMFILEKNFFSRFGFSLQFYFKKKIQMHLFYFWKLFEFN